MMVRPFALAVIFGSLLVSQNTPAQNTPAQDKAAQEPLDQPIERTTVSFVVAPVTVLDKSGGIVNGLQPSEFKLYDNGKEQNITVDVAFQPISLVLAIEAADRVDSILSQIQKIGSLIEPLVIGEQGEAAVLAFDHRIREMQGFTNDATKLKDAIAKIHAGSTSSRMIDAVDRAVFMLRDRPRNRRRIVLLISETRDKASEGKLKDALIAAQLANVTVYTVNISQMVTRLTEHPQPGRPDPLPPAAYNLPGGTPQTPTSVAQAKGTGGVGRVEFGPLLQEIYTDAKGVFVDSPSEVFTKGTGGSEFAFMKQRGLENAIQRISDEIHSQYMISYNPNNKNEGGFHEITVEVDRRDLRVTTRPGYWLASLK